MSYAGDSAWALEVNAPDVVPRTSESFVHVDNQDGPLGPHAPERAMRAALSQLIEPGSVSVARIIAEAGVEQLFARLLAGEIGAGLTCTTARKLAGRDPLELGMALLTKAARGGARFVIPSDAEWPTALDDLNEITDDHDPNTAAPLGLWVRGSLPLHTCVNNAVAIVGARAATAYGIHVARELGYGLAENGWTVVSGAAHGIDGAAHRGALAAGGHTVAVLANGVDGAYPVGNAGLLEHIAETGLVVSEWPPGFTPARYRFLVRNRIIAGLSRGTVVVEAARRSGSRLTARRTLELSRPLMAVPGSITSPMSEGSHELIRQWRAEVVTDTAQVLEIVGELGAGQPAQHVPPDETAIASDRLDPTARAVFNAVPLNAAISHVDLANTAGITSRQARPAIAALLVLDFVEAVGSDCYQLTVEGKRANRRRNPTSSSIR